MRQYWISAWELLIQFIDRKVLNGNVVIFLVILMQALIIKLAHRVGSPVNIAGHISKGYVFLGFDSAPELSPRKTDPRPGLRASAHRLKPPKSNARQIVRTFFIIHPPIKLEILAFLIIIVLKLHTKKNM